MRHMHVVTLSPLVVGTDVTMSARDSAPEVCVVKDSGCDIFIMYVEAFIGWKPAATTSAMVMGVQLLFAVHLSLVLM